MATNPWLAYIPTAEQTTKAYRQIDPNWPSEQQTQKQPSTAVAKTDYVFTPTGGSAGQWNYGDITPVSPNATPFSQVPIGQYPTVGTGFGVTQPAVEGLGASGVTVQSIGGWDYEVINGVPMKALGRTQDTQTASGYPEGSRIISMEGWDVVIDSAGRIVDTLGRSDTTTGVDAQEYALAQQQLALKQQELDLQQQNYLAGLAANPTSWLEYAAASNQPPVIQPWMMPLMPQDYGIMSAGETIPGWSPESMSGMPELMNPSAQYMARIGPTAQQQYLGYERARTGATPEETSWRLWAMAPPSGRNVGLSQVR